MSTVKVNTLTGTSTAGSIAVTGEGNSTTTNLQQGLAKQWVRFSGTSMSVADSFNNSSVTDNGAGDYSPNLSNPMSGENYSPLFSSSGYHELIGNQSGSTTGTTASAYRILGRNSSNSDADTGRVSGSVLGDLA